MKNFFLLLFLFIIAYYLIKAITRLLKLFVRKEPKQQIHENPSFDFSFSKKESKKKFEKDDGEYVDFEEVK